MSRRAVDQGRAHSEVSADSYGGDWEAREQRDFQGAPPLRQPGYYVNEVLASAREDTGVATTTITFYINTREWKPNNRPLKKNARLLAKALDLHVKGQSLEGWDLIAGRLRALVHADLTSKWNEAEALQADRAKDIGLASGRDIYMARRHAKLLSADADSSSGEETRPKKKKKKRGKKKGKKENEGKGENGGKKDGDG
jgi:hypothetical protein